MIADILAMIFLSMNIFFLIMTIWNLRKIIKYHEKISKELRERDLEFWRNLE